MCCGSTAVSSRWWVCVFGCDRFHFNSIQCVPVPLSTHSHLYPCSPYIQWYNGPPSAKKIRAGQDYDLMTAVEDAAKFVEVKVERMDNIALTLQHINDRIVNQDRLWYHLRQSDEPDVAEDSSIDASVSLADSGEGQEEDVFVQTVRNLAPLESKDQPVQVSVIVDPKKLNPPPRGDSESVASRLPAVAQLMPTIPGQQQMYATFTPGMGMKFFVLPQGWNCYQVCNATPPVMTPAPPNPTVAMRGSIGSASPRDSLSVDTRSSGTTSGSDMESEAEAECAKMGSTPTAQAHHAESWPAVPIVQIDNVE